MYIIKGIIAFVMEILETVVFIGSLFIVTYLFIAQPNQVKGASMEPSFYTGNYIFTSKVTYKLREPERGDVVVFHSPKNPEIEYIKRIIGLPGDMVLIQDQQVYINNVLLSEPYIADATTLMPGGFAQNGIPITIPDNYLFVMGDNRPRSSDSREFGPIPLTSVIGQVFYRYFPTDKMGSVNNPHPENIRSETGTIRIYASL